jgi:hypothetical protein
VNLSPLSQCEANIDAWAQHHGFQIMPPFKREVDRCWYRGVAVQNMTQKLIERGVLVPGNYKNHGPTAVAGWREAKTRTAAQVCKHVMAGDTVYEIDFDHWHPWDLVGVIGHAVEVARNKLARRKTCPYEIAKALRKRGVDAYTAV